MAGNEKKAEVNSTSAAYDVMAPRWRLLGTLLGGTEAMRGAGLEYLPQHPAETPEIWEERLNTNVLLNMTELTLDSLSGKPFVDPIKLGEDVPKVIEEQILPDVDLQGNNLDVFCRGWFREGVAKGFSHVLVEFPRVSPRDDGQPRTLDDDRRENLRPYWVPVAPENIIFAYSETVDGVEKLLQVRIHEIHEELAQWQVAQTERIRVLEPGSVRLFEKREAKGKGGGKKKVEWVPIDEYETGLDYIPLVTYYAAREDLMLAKPPLLDLAHLNVAHWQSSSDQRSILTVARFPMLAASGLPEDAEGRVKIGPHQFLHTTTPEGKFYYVEHEGKAIEAGQKDLETLEAQMGSYGAEFLKRKPGNPTATARALDTAESLSPLQAMAIRFEDAVANALSITADWMRLGREGGTIEVEKNFALSEDDDVNLKALAEARKARDISREAYLQGLTRHGVLPEDFDTEEDSERLEAEATNGASLLDLDPSQQDDPDDKDE